MKYKYQSNLFYFNNLVMETRFNIDEHFVLVMDVITRTGEFRDGDT